jgi:hypothetical protein
VCKRERERERERDVNVSWTWNIADCSYVLECLSLTFAKQVTYFLSYFLTFPCKRRIDRYFWKNFDLKECPEYAQAKNLLILKRYISELQRKTNKQTPWPYSASELY